MNDDMQGPSIGARRLGFGGLIPFVGLAAALWLAPPTFRPLAGVALLAYGAVICSFLGAIHWGLSMRDPTGPSTASLLWGVVPGLVGWLALLLGPVPGLLLVAATLGACFAVDRVVYPRHRVQAWLPMRGQLTLVAGLGCLAGAMAPGW
ncbi:DUF3429 family protein [Xylophilus sp. Kf1]|nr:DUF3429 family protein [Xylophilus sp. Kf1]